MTHHPRLDGLTVHEVMDSVRVIAEVLDGDWVMKKMKQEKEVIEQFRLASKNRKHAYLYKPAAHPLIAWAIEFEQWQKASRESGRFELKESVLRLAILGQSLEVMAVM